MIDFIKAEIHGPSPVKLINHPLLNFMGEFEIKTGEARIEMQTAEYQSLKFIITDNRSINLQGSLHKHFTNGVNYNDFTMEEIQSTLAKLTREFGVDLSRSKLHNLEYGVNVKLPFNPKRIIDNLINHKGETFERMYGQAKRTGKQSEKQQYKIKIYNKGAQCHLSDYLLRVEIKVTKMKYLEVHGISTLADLLDQAKMKGLMDDLTNTFKESLMYDPGIDLKKCRKTERDLLMQGRYPGYWLDMKNESKKKHDYYRRRFRQLTQENGQNIQQKVTELLMDKANSLLKTKSTVLSKLTNQVKHQLDQNNHLSGMVIRQVKIATSESNLCKGCGKQIIDRKNIAMYCGEECRIKSKNRRRDVKRPLLRSIFRQNSNPVLFDTAQYIILTSEQLEISKRYGLFEKLISA